MNIENDIIEMLSSFVGVTPSEFNMDADIDLVYDMDSTELTELAIEIEKKYEIKSSKSEREDWKTGNNILKFVVESLSLK